MGNYILDKICGIGGKDKVVVMGMMERGGTVRTMVVDTQRKKELQARVREHVEGGAAIFSDELKSRDWSRSINTPSSITRWNTQTATFTRTAWKTSGAPEARPARSYISVEPFHLFRYLDEQTYRFNNRTMTDAERFDLAVKGIVGNRLT